MKSISALPLKLILGLFLLLQSPLSIAQEYRNYLNIPIVKKSAVKAFTPEEGVYDHAFSLNNKEHWNVKISIPELKPGQQYPLILALHWAGNHSTYKEYSDCLAFPALDTLKAIIIAPSSEGMPWTDPTMEQRVIDLMKKLIKLWPVDENKIIVTGYSNGGIGSWRYAYKYPKLFCAAIPMAGFYKKQKMAIPIFAIHGDEDELFNLNTIRETINGAREKGSQIDLEIMEGFSHYKACNYKHILKEKGLFVLNKILAPSRKD